jgi:hypothetical protein
MNTDKHMKSILTVIALGLWVIILKPFFASTPVSAQVGSKKQYEFLTTYEKYNKKTYSYLRSPSIEIGGEIFTIDDSEKPTAESRKMTVAGENLKKGISMAVSKGWRVHSILPHNGAGTTHGYVVLLEK